MTPALGQLLLNEGHDDPDSLRRTEQLLGHQLIDNLDELTSRVLNSWNICKKELLRLRFVKTWIKRLGRLLTMPNFEYIRHVLLVVDYVPLLYLLTLELV